MEKIIRSKSLSLQQGVCECLCVCGRERERAIEREREREREYAKREWCLLWVACFAENLQFKFLNVFQAS